MASGSFYDYTSSNSINYLYLQTDYTTTAYAGYTRVTATSYIVVKTGSWNFTAYTSSVNPKLSINGSSANLTRYQPSVGTEGNKYKIAYNYVDISHTDDKTITISSSADLSSITVNSTGGKVGSYSLSGNVTLVPLKTNCTAPTTFTVAPNDFETSVTVSWSGAKGGTNNDINFYYIQYATSSNNSTWGDWTQIALLSSSSTSGSETFDMSSKVTRGYYVKFRIRTQGSAGSSYYSGYKESSSVRRKPYTVCTAPTTFTITPNNFETEVAVSWSGAKGGTNNDISHYDIQYSTSSDNSTWSNWTQIDLIGASSSTTSGNKTFDMSSKVTRGHYVKFRIRTWGEAGSSYYSSWKESSSVRRKPYTACTAPNAFLVEKNDFDKNVTLTWGGASGGTNNSINGYLIQFAISSDNSTWGDWSNLTTFSTTNNNGSYVADMSSKMSRGYYVRFRIRTQGNAGSSYYSEYVTSGGVRRNPYTKCTAPTQITLTSEQALDGKKYNNIFESQITIDWSGASGGENNSIGSYQIEYATSDNNSTWGSWKTHTAVTSTSTSGSKTLNMTSYISRGQYVKFRIKTVGAVSGYESDYFESSTMRRNGVPANISSVSINLPTLEYSYGDDIIVSWNKSNDVDNVYKYRVIIQPINNQRPSVSADIIGVNNLTYTFNLSNSLYQTIPNNEQLKFLVKAIDIFGVESNEYTESLVITRYDITGLAIGINGAWVNCQLFVGTNGQWVEQDALAGINGSWVEAYDGT